MPKMISGLQIKFKIFCKKNTFIKKIMYFCIKYITLKKIKQC